MSGLEEIAKLVAGGAKFIMEYVPAVRAIRCELRQAKPCGTMYALDRYLTDVGGHAFADDILDRILDRMAAEWRETGERRR